MKISKKSSFYRLAWNGVPPERRTNTDTTCRAVGHILKEKVAIPIGAIVSIGIIGGIFLLIDLMFALFIGADFLYPIFGKKSVNENLIRIPYAWFPVGRGRMLPWTPVATVLGLSWLFRHKIISTEERLVSVMGWNDVGRLFFLFLTISIVVFCAPRVKGWYRSTKSWVWAFGLFVIGLPKKVCFKIEYVD